MYCRYKKIKEDMPLIAAKLEDDTLLVVILQQDYLLLTSSNSL